MKKIFMITCFAFITTLVFIVNMHVYGQIRENLSPPVNNSCGANVLFFLGNNYFDSNFFSSSIAEKEELSMTEMVDACKKFSPDAYAITCQASEISQLPLPIVLHLKFEHFILITGIENGAFQIYDPSAHHIKKVSQSYLQQNFSGNAIILSKTKSMIRHDPVQDLAAIKGRYMHEYPPPNQNEPGHYRGINGDNVSQGECRNNRGKPLLSFNPIILNIVATDVPLWYKAGKGSDIEFKLVYNGNDKNEITGDLPAPTNYYPMGFGWAFSYAAFYKEQSSSAIILYLPDGQRITFTNVNNVFSPSLATFYHQFVKYPVRGGYGYCLIVKESKLKYRFDNPVHKKLTSIEDRNGNSVILHYDANYNLSAIEDANGRMTNLLLNSDGRIIKATDPIGREAVFSYGFTDNKFLTGITDMGGYISTIGYDSVPIIYQSGAVNEPRIDSITKYGFVVVIKS